MMKKSEFEFASHKNAFKLQWTAKETTTKAHMQVLRCTQQTRFRDNLFNSRSRRLF
jgi:hypothetical protein